MSLEEEIAKRKALQQKPVPEAAPIPKNPVNAESKHQKETKSDADLELKITKSVALILLNFKNGLLEHSALMEEQIEKLKEEVAVLHNEKFAQQLIPADTSNDVKSAFLLIQSSLEKRYKGKSPGILFALEILKNHLRIEQNP